MMIIIINQMRFERTPVKSKMCANTSRRKTVRGTCRKQNGRKSQKSKRKNNIHTTRVGHFLSVGRRQCALVFQTSNTHDL